MADEAFIHKIDRLMLMFKTLGMIQPDETWHYTSFPEESEESFIAARRGNPPLPDGKSAGDTVLEALNALDGSYTGLLRALSLLNAAGLEREAAETAMQSSDIVSAPEKPMNKELIAAFMETITAERGAAKNTIAAYTRDLEDCGEFLDSCRRTFENAEIPDLRAYLAFWHKTACP